MTESTTPQAAQPTSIPIGIGAQYIKDLSFENPHAPQILAELSSQPQMAMDVNVMSRGIGENAFEAVLKIRLESKLGTRTAFIVELAYAGIFSLPALPEEQIKLFLLIEAPRLLFPFARAIISNAVREGGFPNVAIQPIDFMALYASQRDAVGTMTAAGAA